MLSYAAIYHAVPALADVEPSAASEPAAAALAPPRAASARVSVQPGA